MEPDLFDALMNDTAGPVPENDGPVGPALPDVAPVGVKPRAEPGLNDPTSFMDSALGGAAQAVLETKDFLLGEPTDKSETRQRIEQGTKKLSQGSLVNGLTAGVSQFGVGMLGAGKLIKAGKAIGWVGKAASSLFSSKKALAAGEILKAAGVGAVAFDPHAERLSNIVESIPGASNPLTRYLQADPTDSAAEGRFKNALESIGLDLAVIGVLTTGAKVLKAIKSGDAKAVEEAVDEAARAQEVMQQAPDSMQRYTATETPKAANDAAPASGPANDGGIDPATFKVPDEAALAPGQKHFLGEQPGVAANDQNPGVGASQAPANANVEGGPGRPPGAQVVERLDWPQYEGQRTDHTPPAPANDFGQTERPGTATDQGVDPNAWSGRAPAPANDAMQAANDQGHVMRSDFEPKLSVTESGPLQSVTPEIEQEVTDILDRLVPQRDKSASPFVENSKLQDGSGNPEAHGVSQEQLDSGSHVVAGRTSGSGIETVIAIAKDLPDAKNLAPHVARHESIHALRKMGLFTQDEWKALEEAAQGKGWLEKYGKTDPEEAIAEAFAEWAGARAKGRNSKFGPTVGAIFQRIVDFYKDLKASFTGKNKDQWERVFRDIEAGKVGKRDLRETGDAAAKNAITTLPPGTSVERVQGKGRGEAPTMVDLEDQTVTNLITAARKDAEALAATGSWDAAVGAGHVFGKGGSIPWQKLAGTVDGKLGSGVDAFISRVAESLKGDLDKAKGGDVLSDSKVQRMVTQRANLWGEDPAALMGLLQSAGQNARTMAANMEAGFLVAQRAMQDSYTLAARINAGYLDEFGGDLQAAQQALKEMVSVAATAWGHSQSMRASAGRSLRRLRGEFKLNEADVAALQGLDGNQLAKLLAATEGDPRAISKVVSPSLWARGLDAAQYLYVNNLLWGLRTHFVNFLTNSYMVAGRPLERIIGSYKVGGETGKALRQEAAKQYAYMGSSLHEAFKSAVETWKLGDSVMAPHSVEVNNTGRSIGTAVAQMEFKPWTSLPNVLHNALLVGIPKTVGVPTRALGAVDELVKQVVYRSKVQAQAHIEGIAAGLDGKDLTDFVRNRLADSFDDAGRAVDMGALREAQIATFQQDLLPNTVGKSVQVFTNNHAWAKFVLPFVKTPTNVIRMGVKLTPGLNMLQGEYRQMIRGAMGPEAQAQAVGQMAMGTLFLGTASWLASQGFVTGGGPSDPRLAQTLKATGWQPYSFVIPNEDGTKTYVPYGRFDPVAMPFGMVADLVDVLSHGAEEDQSKVEAMATGLLMGLAKQLKDKTYLMSISQTLDAILDPDRSMTRVVGQTASNFVPMASALRFANPDPYLRESRDLMDSIRATIPGFSETLPPRRDVWGDPLTVNKGLWVTGDKDVVDAEVRRMIEEAGVSMGPPGSSVDGVDLREVSMADGRNAYDVYQELAGKPTPRGRSLKDTVAMQMKSEAYAKAPDGDSATRGTKLWMIQGSIKKYREAALKRVRADKNVREALMKKDMEVRSKFAAQRGSSSSPTQQLSNIGQSFGVDLGSLLGGQ